MKRNAAVLLFSVLLTACAQTPASAGTAPDSAPPSPASSSHVSQSSGTGAYRKISAEEARGMLLKLTDAVLLDVRTQEEFDQGHIEGALLLADYDIAAKAEQLPTDKDSAILVYCRSGRRSANAAKQLIEMGYTNVYDFGGIIDWPFDTVKPR